MAGGEVNYTFVSSRPERVSIIGYFSTDQPIETIPYPGSIKLVPSWEIVIKSIISAVIIFFSLIGNVLIIAIVLRNRKMRTATNYYIVNLAVADLMVTISCTWVSLVEDVTEGWVLGALFCKINTFTQILSLLASVLSLTLIAYDRFFGIVFALRAHMTEKRASISLIFIWLISILVALPTLLYRRQKSRQWLDHIEIWCDDQWPDEEDISESPMKFRRIYFISVSVVMYFIPMAVMGIAYAVIMHKLWSTTIPGEIVDSRAQQQARTKKKIIVMLVSILVVFCICWLPCQVMLLYSELRSTRGQLNDWYYDLQFAAYCMAYSNSALNPLIYAGFNENFKKGLISIWRSITCDQRKEYPYGKSVYGSCAEHTTDTAI